QLDHRIDFHREIYSLLKNFDMDTLILDTKSHSLASALINNAYFHDLTKSCKKLEIPFICDDVTPAALHQLYKVMADDSTEFRSLKIRIVTDNFFSFCSLVGLNIREDGGLASSKAIEVFKGCHSGACNLHIFEGKMEIWISHNHEEEMNTMHLISHETQESLEKAKYARKLEKMDVESE
ncbi:hypothetical protein PMAYCL1PPCAC_27963, partial [Pristionchus mayeri]